MKTGLLLLSAALGTAAWAQSAGDYRYFNDFELGAADATLTVHGDGTFVDNGDDMGYVFQNGGGAVRTHYLQLPEDVLSHSATSHEMTIGFWVKRNNATDFWFSPIFTAYGAAPSEGVNTWPMFAVESRGLMYVNNAGWCDFTADDNDNNANYEGTFWLDDNKWHYFTIILTETTAKVSVDANNVLNSWTVDNTDGHYIKGLFDNGADLKYICLGGNQAWSWGDNDPAYAFDDIMITNKALTDSEIRQIMTDKNPKTLVGEKDNTTVWWTAFSDYYTIAENKTLTLEFDNYSSKAANWFNWLLAVTTDADRDAEGYSEYVVLRADNYAWQYGLNTGPDSSHDWFTALTSNFNWDAFKDAMNGSHVVMTITRGGNVVNIHADITGSDNNQYFEDFVINCGDGTQNIRAFLTTQNGHLLVNDLKTTVTDTKITGTITASGYNSFSSYFPLNLTGVKAYKITGVDNANKVVMSEVTGSVPAQTGLLLEGTAGADFTLLPTSAATTAPVGNLLVALPNGGQVAKAESGTNYVFGWEDASKPGFFRVNDVLPMLGAGKAYLHMPAAEAPFLSIDLGGETTGVKSLTPTLSQEEGAYYTLDGRRVSQPTKGLYIVNGKKVMVK